MNVNYHTNFGSLKNYEKGRVQPIDDDVKHYAFSNCFEIANTSKPYEKVVFGQNQIYVLETLRAEGTSPWYTTPHDEFAIVMDGEIEFTFFQLTDAEKPTHKAGACRLKADPKGKRMGRVIARRGHEVLLPQGSAYQLKAAKASVVLIQTSMGPESVEKWSKICVLD